jgi:pyruvate dehydrogenase E1 component alpha subunit
MVRIRIFEEEAGKLMENGKIPGALHLYVGQEAVASGVMVNLNDDDQITSTHRGHGHLVAKGGQFKPMYAELFGRSTGYCKGKGGSMHISNLDVGMLGANGIVGAGPPIAVGAGFSNKYRGTRQVAVTFFGDGASNEGAFHEAANMAALYKLPVLFVCENNGYGEYTAQRNHQAIKDVAAHPPSLVLLDVALPKLDGYKVCRMLKFDERFRHIPIIILSARAQDEDRRLALEMGADQYLTKPYEVKELVVHIRQKLRLPPAAANGTPPEEQAA